MRRALATVLLGIAWFVWGAPAANTRLDAFRTAPRGQRSASDLRRLVAVSSLPADARALVEEAELASEREREWSLIVASLLSPAERADGLARAVEEPAVVGFSGHSLEPELPVLVDALLARYGPETAPVPPAPPRDDWPMIDRRARIRVLLALVRGPGLDDERAAIVLAATLDLLATQARRSEIEAALAEIEVPG
ncbi:MAG: hypothetical protein Q8P41_03790 [Pseudomonadota bacterium]|nr:hypothetical protein [Pseudomonadota bacterium]